MTTSDLPVRSGRGQGWDRLSGCVFPPRLFPPCPLSPAACDRNPSPPHQGEEWNALQLQSSSPPCWAADGQLSTPHHSCGERIQSVTPSASLMFSVPYCNSLNCPFENRPPVGSPTSGKWVPKITEITFANITCRIRKCQPRVEGKRAQRQTAVHFIPHCMKKREIT